MARPFKRGLGYFPLDVGFFQDPKIKELMFENGQLGVIAYLRILTLVYAEGYYLKMDKEELAKLLFYEFRSPYCRSVDRIREAILTMVNCGLLHGPSLSVGVITSSSIQKQYLISTQRRKGEIDKTYWILDEKEEARIEVFKNSTLKPREESALLKVNETITGVNAAITSVNDDSSTQNKNKNKKENKRDIKDKCDKWKEDLPFKPTYYLLCLLNDGIVDISYPKLYELNDMLETLSDSYEFEDFKDAFNYTRAKMKQNKEYIGDVYSYFRESILNNLDIVERMKDDDFDYFS